MYISSWMKFLFKPFDDVCYWWYAMLDVGADLTLAVFPPPTWYPSWMEMPMAFPLVIFHNWWVVQSKFVM